MLHIYVDLHINRSRSVWISEDQILTLPVSSRGKIPRRYQHYHLGVFLAIQASVSHNWSWAVFSFSGGFQCFSRRTLSYLQWLLAPKDVEANASDDFTGAVSCGWSIHFINRIFFYRGTWFLWPPEVQNDQRLRDILCSTYSQTGLI